MLHELALRSRSYRRFDITVPVSLTDLRALADLARLCPSAGNKQPLRFVLCNDPAHNARIYACLKWAAYLTDWEGPEPTERPSAYIVMVNTAPSWDFAKYDLGIMAQTMLLGATEKGFGGCMLASIDRDRLRDVLGLDKGHEICLVLALGKPVEDVRIVPVADSADPKAIRYYRDSQGVHYVPKLDLDTLILHTCSHEKK